MLGGGLYKQSRTGVDEVASVDLELIDLDDGLSLCAQKYAARFQRAEFPQLEAFQDGLKLFRLLSIPAQQVLCTPFA